MHDCIPYIYIALFQMQRNRQLQKYIVITIMVIIIQKICLISCLFV